MASLDQLWREVGMAREQYFDAVGKLPEEQAQWRPSPTEWGAVELTEHLYWAEHGGIRGMWRALRVHQAGHPIWEGERIHRGLPIEAIIARS